MASNSTTPAVEAIDVISAESMSKTSENKENQLSQCSPEILFEIPPRLSVAEFERLDKIDMMEEEIRSILENAKKYDDEDEEDDDEDVTIDPYDKTYYLEMRRLKDAMAKAHHHSVAKVEDLIRYFLSHEERLSLVESLGKTNDSTIDEAGSS